MCQYSSENGKATPWHMVHLGSRAIGGAGLVIVEATAVSPEGRITPGDAGIWNDEQASALEPITQFIKQHQAVAAIQLAHAGRKASTRVPWQGEGGVADQDGGWTPLAPSALRFHESYREPQAMTENEIESVVHHFCEAAKRSLRAGFQVVEIHMAHGYLLHEFLSPLSNQRTDQYGGSFENRIRLPLRIAQEVRQLWPSKWPVLVRVSSTDWTEGGWDLHQTVEFCCALKEVGVDAIDCSSGGLTATAKIPVQPGYQVPFSEAIRKETGLPTLAVGMITEAPQAEQIVALGQADFVLLARELLRDPYWPLHAAHTLGVDIAWPSQYERAKPRPK